MLDSFGLTAETIFGAASVLAALVGAIAGSVGLFYAKAPDKIAEAELERQPFETTALAKYYTQVLRSANISFWFSLTFASIGFGVIVFALFMHDSDIQGTLVKVVSGVVIDAVASLFFVQSTRAQKSMSAFFEKLRLDRLNAEARGMIKEIEDKERRDQLRSQLVLKYAGIEKLLEGGSPPRGTAVGDQ